MQKPTLSFQPADPEFDNLAVQVLILLRPVPQDCCDTPQIIELFKEVMRIPPGLLGTCYVNPLGRLDCEHESALAQFLDAARRMQKNWLRQFNKFLQTSTFVKRHYQQINPIIRQLELTGVLVIKGQHIFPNRWPKTEADLLRAKEQPNSLIGKRFTRLTVLAEQAEHRYECRCDCGQQIVARRKHLLTGRTKSCGCLRLEKLEFYEERRFRRFK